MNASQDGIKVREKVEKRREKTKIIINSSSQFQQQQQENAGWNYYFAVFSLHESS